MTFEEWRVKAGQYLAHETAPSGTHWGDNERHLLKIDVEGDVRALRVMEKQVSRDAHRMKAFVRFRRVEGATPEQFVAWHRPITM